MTDRGVPVGAGVAAHVDLADLIEVTDFSTFRRL
jgi:hypothetical protein